MLFLILVCVYILLSALCIGVMFVGLYQKNSNAICKSKRRLDGKTAFVTGGTCGMGLEIATDLALRGAKVIVACPFEDEGKTGRESIIKNSGNRNVVFHLMDLASFESVRKVADIILKNESRLDILVNNAGVNAGNRLTEDGWNFVFQINYLGAVLLTFLLLPLLKKSGCPQEPSRIVNTSSISHKLRDKAVFSNWKSPEPALEHYTNSKFCIALFTRELAKRLKTPNVIVNVVDPGIVGTRIYTTCSNRFIGPIAVYFISLCSKTSWEGAQTAIHVAACNSTRKENGKYFSNCKVSMTTPIPIFFDDKHNEELWEKTMDALDLKDDDLINKL